MSIFRDLGRRAERFKQRVSAAAEATFECTECGELYHEDHERCPACGSEAVVHVE